MNGNTYFPCPYGLRNAYKVKCLRRLQARRAQDKDGGGTYELAAVGRWISLLGLLYENGGRISCAEDLEAENLADELGFNSLSGLYGFLTDCARADLIDAELWDTCQSVINNGVLEQLEYQTKKAQASRNNGRKGGRPKKERAENMIE